MRGRHARVAIWPKAQPRLTAAFLSGHSAVGLAFGALIYLVCLTGTISVLVDEMKLIEQPSPAAGLPRPGALNHAVASVLAGAPGAATLYATAPSTPRQRLTITTHGAGGERAFIADAQGLVMPARTPFADFVTELHMTLTAPAPWGSLLVGVAGVALFSLLLSGILSHPRVFRDAFRLRLGGSERLREADLHNRLGVWGLPFHVIVTLTGALFGLAGMVSFTIAALGFHGDQARVQAPITGPMPAVDPRPAPAPDLEALAARAIRNVPGSRLAYVGLTRPGTAGSRVVVEVSAPGRLPRGEDIYFNAGGQEIGRGRFTTGSLGMQAYSAAAQLHFGFFGGLPVHLVYVALGAALTFISASGVTIWLARRRDRSLPSDGLRAAWFAWTWGAPVSLVLAALGSRVAAPAPIFWIAVGAFQIGAQLRARSTPAARARRHDPRRTFQASR